MSISLIGVMVGLPIALAMRGIMGKEKFEEWLAKSDYILYTNFLNENEMQRIVQSAGYDVTDWYGSLKTHLTEEKLSYFLWGRENGRIIAKLSIYDDKKAIHRFVSAVEKKAGRKVFSEKTPEAEANMQDPLSKEHAGELKTAKRPGENPQRQQYKEQFPSVYVDADLVLKILRQYRINVLSFQENRIKAEYECYKMLFFRDSAEEPFEIDIVSDSNKMKSLYNCLDSMTEEYYASVQEKTYRYIREQIEEEGLEIENEQVLEDNSIVITVAV